MILSDGKDANESEYISLLESTEKELEHKASTEESYLLANPGIKFERIVHSIMARKAVGTPFESNVKIVSGQLFPDIVVKYCQNGFYGLEVKTTTKNHWTTTGSSIFEGTRVPDVQSVFLCFAKLVSPIEYKFGRYERYLADVAVTHSPRYLIDMTIQKEQTIFEKIGISYEEFRNHPSRFNPIRDYYRSRSDRNTSDVWWCSDDSSTDSTLPIQVRMFGALNHGEKARYKTRGMACFPEMFSSSQYKYKAFVLWMVSRHGVICSNTRDLFTAGGRETLIVNGVTHQDVPKIFYHLQNNVNAIARYLQLTDTDFSDLQYYWKTDSEPNAGNVIDMWIELVELHSQSQLSSFGFTASQLIEEQLINE